MGMENFTRHQQGIIKRYYQNLDQVSLQRLGELVGELYLAEGKKRERTWKAVVAAMQKLGVPQARIEHILAQNDPRLVANLVTELQGTK